MKNIVTLWAWTGQASIASSLDMIDNKDISVSNIVCVTDNGGSTWEIRKIFDIPAMWDARNVFSSYF